MSLVTDAVVTAAAPQVAVAKIVGLTLIASAFLGMAGTSWYLFKELKESKKENGQLTEENNTMRGDLELARNGMIAIDAGLSLSGDKKDELEKRTREIRNQLKLREQEIDRLNISLEEKTRLKSQARAQSVWDTFCHVQPNNSACQKEIVEKADQGSEQPRAQESAP